MLFADVTQINLIKKKRESLANKLNIVAQQVKNIAS